MSIPLVSVDRHRGSFDDPYAYRRMVAGSADELVHLSDVSDAVLEKQEATATRIQQLDRIVMILAIVFVVYGIALGSLKVYQAFTSIHKSTNSPARFASEAPSFSAVNTYRKPSGP